MKPEFEETPIQRTVELILQARALQEEYDRLSLEIQELQSSIIEAPAVDPASQGNAIVQANQRSETQATV